MKAPRLPRARLALFACMTLAASARADDPEVREETDPAALFRSANEALAAERHAPAMLGKSGS